MNSHYLSNIFCSKLRRIKIEIAKRLDLTRIEKTNTKNNFLAYSLEFH